MINRWFPDPTTRSVPASRAQCVRREARAQPRCPPMPAGPRGGP
jgi:hypothetical protein